jgi:hypothetical protein
VTGGGLAALAAVMAVVAGMGLTQERHRSAAIDVAGLPDMPAERAAAYAEAAGHRELFQHLPCYCGCALLDTPHDSLDRCFFAPGGAVEAHAAGCRICAEIALMAANLAHRGVAHVAIRAQVDRAFAGTGPATNTPPP